MDANAQSIINQVSSLTGSFGTPVTVNRVVQSQTPVRDVFGQPENATTQTFTLNVIVESQKPNLMAILAGGKVKEELRLIVQAGQILNGDEVVYGGNTYKVTFAQPVPFAGSDVVDFIHAEREVK